MSAQNRPNLKGIQNLIVRKALKKREKSFIFNYGDSNNKHTDRTDISSRHDDHNDGYDDYSDHSAYQEHGDFYDD